MNKITTRKKPACGLCGSAEKVLIKTPCCNNWICDDEHNYVMFSYARNSCSRNHRRYTLCGFHFIEGHEKKWKNCKTCKKDLDLSDYVDMGTNEYNFEVLKNPEKVTISCVHCKMTANSVEDFAYKTPKGYYCTKKECQDAAFNR